MLSMTTLIIGVPWISINGLGFTYPTFLNRDPSPAMGTTICSCSDKIFIAGGGRCFDDYGCGIRHGREVGRLSRFEHDDVAGSESLSVHSDFAVNDDRDFGRHLMDVALLRVALLVMFQSNFKLVR